MTLNRFFNLIRRNPSEERDEKSEIADMVIKDCSTPHLWHIYSESMHCINPYAISYTVSDRGISTILNRVSFYDQHMFSEHAIFFNPYDSVRIIKALKTVRENHREFAQTKYILKRIRGEP